MTTFMLICLVEGDNLDDNAFVVNIDCSKSVDKLKNTIKEEQPNTFANVDAKNLQLWQVDMPFTAAQQIETAEFDKDKKLSAVNKVVDCWDPQPPENCIHILIACPPGKCVVLFCHNILDILFVTLTNLLPIYTLSFQICAQLLTIQCQHQVYPQQADFKA